MSFQRSAGVMKVRSQLVIENISLMGKVSVEIVPTRCLLIICLQHKELCKLV